MSNTLVLAFLLALLVVVSATFVGRDLIEAYFRRKERFVEHINDQLKGGQDGTHE